MHTEHPSSRLATRAPRRSGCQAAFHHGLLVLPATLTVAIATVTTSTLAFRTIRRYGLVRAAGRDGLVHAGRHDDLARRGTTR